MEKVEEDNSLTTRKSKQTMTVYNHFCEQKYFAPSMHPMWEQEKQIGC